MATYNKFTHPVQAMRVMQGRMRAVNREMAVTASRLAPALQLAAGAEMLTEIYAVPIPTVARRGQNLAPIRGREFTILRGRGTGPARMRSASTLKWHRTGQLLAGEKARAEGTRVVLYNRVRHARPRYDLGTPRGRRIVSVGVKSVQWQRQAIDRLMPMIQRERSAAITRALANP